MAAACVLVSLLLSGCAWTSDLDLMLYKGPEGSVFLERFPERSAPASHPVSLDEALIARILGGVQIEEQSNMIDLLLTKPPGPIQAFRDEEIAFLSPLLAEALALAAPDQRAGFRLTSTDPSPEVDAGRVYVENTFLHLLLSKRPSQRGGLGRSLDVWTLKFSPLLATKGQKVSNEPSRIYPMDGREAKSLIIDYTLVARSSPSGSTTGPDHPERPSGSSSHTTGLPQKEEKDGAGTAKRGDRSRADELETVKEQLEEKSRDIKALEERVRELQRQMEEGGTNPASPETDTAPGQ